MTSLNRIALLARDYRHVEANGRNDLSHAFPEVVRACDEHGCHAIVCSLFSFESTSVHEIPPLLAKTRNLQAVWTEEFHFNPDIPGDRPIDTVRLHAKHGPDWTETCYRQHF
jgi:hypothetical protein